MKKNLAQLTFLKTHYLADSAYPKIRFQVPDPSLALKIPSGLAVLLTLKSNEKNGKHP